MARRPLTPTLTLTLTLTPILPLPLTLTLTLTLTLLQTRWLDALEDVALNQSNSFV